LPAHDECLVRPDLCAELDRAFFEQVGTHSLAIGKRTSQVPRTP
jgi:hypothetical protein